MSKIRNPQCEGWIHTPAFVLGGFIGWHQCENIATWKVTFKREAKKQTLPACDGCYEKLLKGEDKDGAKLIKSVRIKANKSQNEKQS